MDKVGKKQRSLMVATWVAIGVGVPAYAMWTRRCHRSKSETSARNPQDEEPLKGKEKMVKHEKLLWKTILESQANKKSVCGRAAVLALAIGFRLLVSIKVSNIIGDLGSLLAKRDWIGLGKVQVLYALWTVPAALINSFVEYASASFALSLRQGIVEHIHDSLSRERGQLSRLSTRFPDAPQRITAEATKAGEEFATLFASVVKPITESVVLSITLAKMMGLGPLLSCYTYFALAATWTRSVTPSLTYLTSEVQAEEGVFLSSHSRLNEYAEEIDFSNGTKSETYRIQSQFRALVKLNDRLAWQKFFSSAIDSYIVRYTGILVALSMMSPALKKQGKTETVKDPTSFFLTCLHLLVNLMTAFKDVAVGFRTLQALRGTAGRIMELVHQCEVSKLKENDSSSTESSWHKVSHSAIEADVMVDNDSLSCDSIELLDVSIETPNLMEGDKSKSLFKNLNLRFRRGENVFIQGENMIGKTSVFRVLAGLWPIESGTISFPRGLRTMFLTQRPFLVPGLSIREQLTFPLLDFSLKDDEFIPALNHVGLGEKISSLSPSSCLPIEGMSAGEMQRFACARALIQKPDFLFMDEATCSCTETFERDFVQMCTNLNITVVLISHREVSKTLFPVVVKFESDGSVRAVLVR